MYYLSILCVAKYHNILDAMGSEDTTAEFVSESLLPPGENVRGNLDAGDQKIGGPNNVFSGDVADSIPTTEETEGLVDKDRNSDVPMPPRPRSVDTDCSTTPDLDQAFHFPTPEGGSGGGEQSMPASVTFYQQSRDTSEQIKLALKLVGPFLCRLLVTNRSSLSKVLVGSDSKPLLTDGMIHRSSLVCIKNTLIRMRTPQETGQLWLHKYCTF